MTDKKFEKDMKKELKKEALLNSICEECGRKVSKDVTLLYCNKCWNTMKREIK